MRVLVIGGTGTVGSQVVRELAKRHVDVVVLTRDGSKPLPVGARSVVGDILDPATVRSAFAGVEGAFLLHPVSQTEAHEGLMALNGARLAGLRRAVYLSAHQADRLPWIPHFGTKLAIEAALRDSGIPATILRAENFYQNDLRYRAAILDYGVYPQPLGAVGAARVDVRDIAEAAAIALTESGHEGASYDLVGPQVLSGPSTAEAWSRAAGRRVVYAGDDLDLWERQSLAFLPPWMVFSFRRMYEQVVKNGSVPAAEAVPRLSQLLRHSPRRFDDFARETVIGWRKPELA